MRFFLCLILKFPHEIPSSPPLLPLAALVGKRTARAAAVAAAESAVEVDGGHYDHNRHYNPLYGLCH